MNLSLSESSLGRHRCRQWVPIITQQLRLRHLYQILAFNLPTERKGSFYFTLHLTSMSSPFYTSGKISNINPKWPEINILENSPNITSSRSVVIRIWQQCFLAKNNPEDLSKAGNNSEDHIVLTWGVNFTGLVYLGNKISEIQPCYFKNNTVIFYINGGYFTSHFYIRTDLKKPVPFAKNLNVIDTVNDDKKAMYRKLSVQSHRNELQLSYNVEKLRRLQDLQFKIKNKSTELQLIKDKINKLLYLEESSSSSRRDVGSPVNKQVPESSLFTDNIRYAPQLLTMNSLNRMLHEKPTRLQKLEMVKVNKEIEISKFKNHLLATEKDKKNVALRKLKDKLNRLTDENEERNSDLMENYHKLSKESEKLREYKRSLLHHRELLSQINSQLQHRRAQLLQELLQIYPIKKIVDDRYTVLGVHLPNSDVLAECSDTGLSVALGYITHTLTMCSTFLQVPLRYPMTHYGSRSSITDQVSLSLPDRERDFPLYTKGKEKAQFSYAVYLLNKNLAQLRWLFGLNTNNLKATLPNLLTFLNGPIKFEQTPPQSTQHCTSTSTTSQYGNVKIVDVTAAMATTITNPTDVKAGNSNLLETEVNLNPFENLNERLGVLEKAANSNLIKTPGEMMGDNATTLNNQSDNQDKGEISKNSTVANSPIVSLTFLRNNVSSNSIHDMMADSLGNNNSGVYSKSGGSPNKRAAKKGLSRETGKGLSEILAIPEAFLNKQISKDSMTSYMSWERRFQDIKIKNGLEENLLPIDVQDPNRLEPIEQGTDPLDITSLVSRSIKIHSDQHVLRLCSEENMLKHDNRISRSVGSYSDDDVTLLYNKATFDLGSEPILNVTCNTDQDKTTATSKTTDYRDTDSLNRFDSCCGAQRDFLEQWSDVKHTSASRSSSGEVRGDVAGRKTSFSANPLTERTDRLLTTKSFNLVKPKL